MGARLLQGVGGALIFAPTIAILTDAFPSSERGRAIGLNAIAVAAGVSAGPALRGLSTEHLTWRWILLVSMPIGIAAVLASRRWLPPSRRQPEQFDLLGAALLGLGLSGLTLSLSFGAEWLDLAEAPGISCTQRNWTRSGGSSRGAGRSPEP